MYVWSCCSGPASPHLYCTNLLQVLKVDLKKNQKNQNQNNQNPNNKNQASSCSKDVARVWRLPSVKIVVAVPELVCAFTRLTRWLSFVWIWNFVLTLHFCMHSGNLNCHCLQVPRENGTPCSVHLDYNEIVATYSACSLWKDCDTRHIVYGYRSSLIWAICQKSWFVFCEIQKKEIPWSANDGFLLT